MRSRLQEAPAGKGDCVGHFFDYWKRRRGGCDDAQHWYRDRGEKSHRDHIQQQEGSIVGQLYVVTIPYFQSSIRFDKYPNLYCGNVFPAIEISQETILSDGRRMWELPGPVYVPVRITTARPIAET